MNYPIVKVKTKDQLNLYGFLAEPESGIKNSIIIHIHGTGGNFFGNDFYEERVDSSLKLNCAFLTTNNRGTGIYEVETDTITHGASCEIFEDCLLDIDAWVELILTKGYQNIILEGHSFGTEKCVYYMANGKYKDKIKGLVLLGFCDTIGTQKKHSDKTGKDYMAEAKDLISKGKGDYLLSDLFSFAGELPITAKTYVNFFENGSELSSVMPLDKGKLDMFSKINVPVLGVIGDQDQKEYTIMPIRDAINLLKTENKLAEAFQINDCDHGFTGKEKELSETITDFLVNRLNLN